jgi:UDP-N-acetylmuramate--alanine ligase
MTIRPPAFPSSVPDLSRPRRIHVIAAGGAAMSAIALIVARMGHQVTGSDQIDSDAVARLRAAGIEVTVGHDAAALGDADLVFASVAVPPSNVELQAAFARGLDVSIRGDVMEALGSLRRTLAISGTAGKTTTSAMAVVAMRAAGLDPSFIVGGVVRGIDAGAHWSDSDWLCVEADESDGSHLRFRAEAAVVTNVEPDHLDYWGDEAALETGFVSFLDQARTAAVTCADDAGARRIAQALGSMSGAVTYGQAVDADYRIADLRIDGLRSSFDVIRRGERCARLELAVPGAHNAANATAVVAVLDRIGIDPEQTADALRGFSGVSRRFEWRGESHGVTFVDDYAHLPSKVAAAVGAAAAGGWKRVVAVFEPHRYTRIRDVGTDFASSFDGADVVVVTGLYAAGQDPIEGIDHRTVSDAVRRARPALTVIDAPTRDELVDVLIGAGDRPGLLQSGDLCLTMNAGTLTTLPDDLLARRWGGR